MKLEYNILWLEDEEDEDLTKLIEAYLGGYGFDAKIINCGDNKEFNSKNLDFKKIDLLICDYHLSNRETSLELMKKIQEKNIYFEVIFYSGHDDFEEVVKKEGHNFQGIFYCKRDNLKDKIFEVLDLTLKKYLDMNNLRGIVLAEVAYLENLMKKILKEYFKKASKEKDKIKDEILKIIAGRYRDNFKEIMAYRGKSIELKEMLKKESCPSFIEIFDDKAWHVNTNIKLELFHLIIHDIKIFDKNHLHTELIKKRNDLSHGNVNEEDFLDDVFKIDITKFKEIMENVKFYKSKFLELQKELAN
jgi:DNA-binding NarL/FixJ family response regulator